MGRIDFQALIAIGESSKKSLTSRVDILLQSASKPVGEPVSQPVSEPVSQPVRQRICQPISQPLDGQLACLLASYQVNQPSA